MHTHAHLLVIRSSRCPVITHYYQVLYPKYTRIIIQRHKKKLKDIAVLPILTFFKKNQILYGPIHSLHSSSHVTQRVPIPQDAFSIPIHKELTMNNLGNIRRISPDITDNRGLIPHERHTKTRYQSTTIIDRQLSSLRPYSQTHLSNEIVTYVSRILRRML